MFYLEPFCKLIRLIQSVQEELNEFCQICEICGIRAAWGGGGGCIHAWALSSVTSNDKTSDMRSDAPRWKAYRLQRRSGGSKCFCLIESVVGYGRRCLTEQLLACVWGLYSIHLTKGTGSLQKSNCYSSGGVVTTLWPQRLTNQGSILGGCKRGFRPRSTQWSSSEGCGAPLLRTNRRGCAPHHSPTGSYVFSE